MENKQRKSSQVTQTSTQRISFYHRNEKHHQRISTDIQYCSYNFREQSGEENKIYNILFSTFSFPRKQSKVKRVEKNTGEFKGHNDETKTYGI